MKQYLLGLFLFGTLCLAGQVDVTPYNFDQIRDKINNLSKEKPTVVNFWATWCVPCVEELPFFEKLAENEDYHVVMVSLDFITMIDKKLVPFIENHPLENNVLVWDQKNTNKYIPEVDDQWSGAIPATWVITAKGEKFHEGKFETYEDLEGFIKN